MTEPFVPDKYYHIYNRGNNRGNLFNCDEDYLQFLRLYSIYAEPVLDTYSWCLMKNHFHFCIRIKKDIEFGCCDKRNRCAKDAGLKWRLFPKSVIPENFQVIPNPARMLNFMFDSYAKYFNFKYKRTGAVLERGVERKHIESNDYLMDLIVYIHNNPVKHGVTSDPALYKWSSYNAILNGNPAFCSTAQVLKLFDDKDNFIFVHKAKFANSPEWGDY